MESVDDETSGKGDVYSDVEFTDAQEGDKGDKRNKSKRKRKNPRAQSLPDSKRGRPPTSGEYVDLAAKKQTFNEQQRIEQDLDTHARLKSLSSDEIYSSMKLDLESIGDR